MAAKGGDAHSTARARRRIAIDALGRELDRGSGSAAHRLGSLLGDKRSLVVSGDIDGIVSAAMLGSVAPGFEIVAFVMQSQTLLVHPSVSAAPPADLFGIDIFSVQFDNVSNHIVKWGKKQLKITEVLSAFAAWDASVDVAASQRLLAVPALWAGTQAGYEDPGQANSANYKYPFGTAQILLAMLEASGNPPKFFDQTYLPWLIANCDGGVSSYAKYAANARVWWPVMAGAVGAGSLTEQIFRKVDTMRPHDFLDAVHMLDRERQASSQPAWLNDAWNLAGQTATVVEHTLEWLFDLTGWRDSVRGGVGSIGTWVELPVNGRAQVYYTSKSPKDTVLQANPTTMVRAKDDPVLAAHLINGAVNAVNANFYVGGQTGSRFNWVGGW